jgi:hypothetical protein
MATPSSKARNPFLPMPHQHLDGSTVRCYEAPPSIVGAAAAVLALQAYGMHAEAASVMASAAAAAVAGQAEIADISVKPDTSNVTATVECDLAARALSSFSGTASRSSSLASADSWFCPSVDSVTPRHRKNAHNSLQVVIQVLK